MYLLAQSAFFRQPVGDSPFELRDLLFSFALPLIIGILLSLPGSRKRREARVQVEEAREYAVEQDDRSSHAVQRRRREIVDEPPPRDQHAWRIPLALGLPIMLAFLLLHGDWNEKLLGIVPGLPGERWHSLMWAAGVAIAVGMVMSFTPRTWWVRALLFAALGLGVTACIWPEIASEELVYKLIPPIAVFLLGCCIEPLLVRRAGVSVIFPIGLAIAVSAALLLVTVSFSMPLPYIAMGMALLGMFFVSLLPGRTVQLGDGAVCVIVTAMVLFPFVVQFHLFHDAKPYVAFALPTIALLAMWFAEPRLHRISRIALVVVMCAGAIWMIYRWHNPASEGADVEDDPYAEMYGDMY